MEEQLISLETAKLAKERGFDVPVEFFYVNGKPYPENIKAHREYVHLSDEGEQLFDYFYHGLFNWNKLRENNFISMQSGFSESAEENYNIIASAPTQSLLQKWLREIHKIHIEIDYLELSEVWVSDVCFYLEPDSLFSSDGYVGDSYEDVLEKALYESLKLI